MNKIILTDTSLRDGNHTVKHQFNLEEIKKICIALDNAGVDIIELGHGDGLTGSTINYGFSKEDDYEAIKIAVENVSNAKIAVLLLPGIGTVPDMKKAYECGARVVRIATHVTEADISMEHIHVAKEIGFLTVGFLMMAHRAPVDGVLHEAQKMESYGADIVYVTDSAGAMIPSEVREKISALKENLKVDIGFHSHNNLGLAIGNSLAAIEAGAKYIDGSLAGLGAGAGNTSTEMLVGVLNKAGIPNNADFYKSMDAAKILREIVKSHGVELANTQDPLMLGYAGVYSSFMLHAKKAAERFKVDYREIIEEAGRKSAVGGQEDWLYEIADRISRSK
ncbi:4-hydroxy-2-oxovalerate aldolase [Microaceticoccus formicicus]|uniref:4-hydroxy-2-oxovalerate aldolase n=1 Tax=Microaceticoccus formicicus TaxID=3118105 RepID=UPI003CD05063|nr:4-hydroxy-2-oxovalerate aldolase [Peptoniphilaceae bacterium AMB_02]